MYEPRSLGTLLSVDAVITSFDTVHPAGFYFGGEMHDFWEAVCIIRGSATATADDRVYQLKAGDLLFHEPLEFHRIWADEGEHRVVIFSFAAHGEGMDFFRQKLFALTQSEMDEYILIGKKLQDVITGCSDAEVNIAKIMLERFLLNLYNKGGGKSCGGDSEFGRIVGVMRECISQNLTIEDIAKKCNMSPSALKKHFAKFADTGVIKYFNGMKIRCAIDRMQSGMSIKETAFALGFSSINYFHTVFKRETGMTPIDYLQNVRR